MSTSIQEYTATEAALADLAQRYKGVLFDVTTRDGMQAATKGRAELRTHRINLEKTRVILKSGLLETGRRIDGEAKRITAEIEALENPIDDQIKIEEKRKEDIRMAAVRAKQERIAAEGLAAKEAEEKRMAEERAEIARQQAELAKAEQARIAAEAESRRKIEEEARAHRLKIEQEERAARMELENADRKAREERDALEAQAKALRDADQARIDEERSKVEAAKREQEDRARMEREAIEAKEKAARDKSEAEQRKKREAQEVKEREIRRKQAERADARELLQSFVERFGSLPEFAGIGAQIIEFLGTEVTQ